MKKYYVEMCVAQNVTIEGIEAENSEKAIQKAKEMFNEWPGDYVDTREISIDQVTGVGRDLR